MNDHDRDFVYDVRTSLLVVAVIAAAVSVVLLCAGCGDLATDAWAITPQPTATHTATPTPTPTPVPPATVCTVTVPDDGLYHVVSARVYYWHEEFPCVLYNRTVSSSVESGTYVEVNGEGSPAGAQVWIDGVFKKSCGEAPIYTDDFEDAGNCWASGVQILQRRNND